MWKLSSDVVNYSSKCENLAYLNLGKNPIHLVLFFYLSVKLFQNQRFILKIKTVMTKLIIFVLPPSL